MRIEVPRHRPASIRLAPLIDVVFILLVFFMLASSFLDWRAFDLNLPVADARPDPDRDPIVIHLAGDGTLEVAGEIIATDALAASVRGLLEGDPGRPVILRPAAGAPVQLTFGALDRLRAGGITEVSLAGGAP